MAKQKKKADKSEKDIQKETLKSLENIRGKLARKRNTREVANEFFDSVEAFFESRFDMSYEFTYEELMAEIDRRRQIKPHHKQKIKAFSHLASSLKYRASDPDKNEIEALISQFQEIVTSVTKKKRITKKSKPSAKISFAAEHFVEDAKEKIDRTLHKAKHVDEKLNKKIKETEKALRDNDIYKALDIYEEIQKEFDQLPAPAKKKHFDKILKLHSRLEELKNVFSTLAYHEDDIIDSKKHGDGIVTQTVNSVGTAIASFRANTSEHDIQKLIAQAEDSLDQHNIKNAANTYEKLQNKFQKLPRPMKKVYHKKILDFHKKLISYAS